MKDVISKISITTFFLAYLFSCGILYLISFWSTFDFDITNYIELLDIPKSFVFPLMTGLGITIFSIIAQTISGNFKTYERSLNDSVNASETKPPKKQSILVRMLLDWEFWIGITLTTCIILYKPRRDWVFSIAGILIIIYCVVKFVKHPRLRKQFSSFGLRLFLALVIFYIPIHCFLIGKKNSIEIWENNRYFKVKKIVFKKEEIESSEIKSDKLIGKLGSNIFLSDTLNTSIVVLNMETIKTVEYILVDKYNK